MYYFSFAILLVLIGLNALGCGTASVKNEAEKVKVPEIINERDDSAAAAVAIVMCHCTAVKEHLQIVSTHNESEDAAEKARLKLALPKTVRDMDGTCMGEFRKAATQAQDKQRFQRIYANMLYDSCPAVAKGLHVTGATTQ